MMHTKIYITYHDDKLIKKYNLNKFTDEIHILFPTHKQLPLKNLNHLGKVINEACALYYVWKNQLKSDFVGFEHYRRHFSKYLNLKNDECQIINYWPGQMQIRKYYYACHNKEDFDIILDIIKDKYGKHSKYYRYLSTNKYQYFITNEMFIMSWKKFNQLCNFVFGIYFEFDRRIECNLQLENYLKRYDNNTYQIRAFYIERLISCWIMNNFKRNKLFYVWTVPKRNTTKHYRKRLTLIN